MSFEGISDQSYTAQTQLADKGFVDGNDVSSAVLMNPNVYARVEASVAQEADRPDTTKYNITSNSMMHDEGFQTDSSYHLFPMPPRTNHTNHPGQFVTMSDVFTLLRTSEAQNRLSPEKGSRLRHILMEVENSAQTSRVCWVNVVFRVLCELIPAPVCPATSCSDGVHSISSISMHQILPSSSSADIQRHQLQTYRGTTGLNQDAIVRTASTNRISPPVTENPTSTVHLYAPQEILCTPCLQSEGKTPTSNEDAVAALLDMRMSQSTVNKNKQRINSQKSSGAAIYPYPFSTIKDPKLYRRTRCKVPNCPNNGFACPSHGHNIKVCSIELCTNRAVKSGVCSKHGAKRPLCRVEGCANQSKREGRCIKHGAVYGSCSMESCQNLARSGGLCRKHGAK